ncbi:MAG: AAA family ATPase [Bilophila wadsworthia]
MSKETLRKYLLTSSAEAIPQARPSLLSCFTNAENPKPQLQDRLSAAGEALESCSETALQSWFDPLEILLDQEAGTLAVRFHASSAYAFPACSRNYSKKRPGTLGKGLSITYGAGKFTPSPPVPFVQPAPESRQDALHPAVANPMPFGEEWTFDTFIGNGKHKWALSLARDITRRAVYRATHGRAPSLDDIGEAPGLLVLCGPHGTGKTHLLRAIGNELFRTLGSDLYYASLSDLELLFAGRSVLAARQELLSKEAVLIDDFQHLSRIPDKTPTTASRFRAQIVAEPEQPAGPSVREELCLLLDRFMDQGKPVIVAGVGRPRMEPRQGGCFRLKRASGGTPRAGSRRAPATPSNSQIPPPAPVQEQLLSLRSTARMSGGFPASSSGWRPTAPCSAAIFPNRICSTSCGRAATAPR